MPDRFWFSKKGQNHCTWLWTPVTPCFLSVVIPPPPAPATLSAYEQSTSPSVTSMSTKVGLCCQHVNPTIRRQHLSYSPTYLLPACRPPSVCCQRVNSPHMMSACVNPTSPSFVSKWTPPPICCQQLPLSNCCQHVNLPPSVTQTYLPLRVLSARGTFPICCLKPF